MKLVNYVKDGRTSAGVVRDGKIFDLQASASQLGFPADTDLHEIEGILSSGGLERLSEMEDNLDSGDGIPFSSVKLLAPVRHPEKILCVAVNYVSHGKEGNVKPPSEPYFFTKFANAIVGPGDAILVPKFTKKADWEVELAVIIGKKGKNIPKQAAMDYVAGYSVANDVSFRDLQFPPGWPEKLNPFGQNWVKGKGLDTAYPIGPWLVTKDEVKDPYGLRISLSLNGEVMQDSTTAEMVSKIDSLIEYISAGMTLRPGDIISTGTPLGVAVFTGRRFLSDGDSVEATISEIGTLTNVARAEQTS